MRIKNPEMRETIFKIHARGMASIANVKMFAEYVMFRKNHRNSMVTKTRGWQFGHSARIGLLFLDETVYGRGMYGV